jgi:enoyl-CoA hydratase
VREAGINSSRTADSASIVMYDVPEELVVEADGPIRVIRLNRPDDLNAVNRDLHEGIADLWPQINDDLDARAVVITGNGRAFSAGGDFGYIRDQVIDTALRRASLDTGQRLVLNLIQCRVPVIAAVNGPAVGLGCSLVALSDMVYMSNTAHLSDPHVIVGLVAADGGALAWPFNMSLMLAKEFAFTGDRITAERAHQMGLVNHVCDPDKVVAAAIECAHRIAKLPPYAVQMTKRLLNIHLERAVLATIDFAAASEYESFATEDVRAFLERMSPAGESGGPTLTDREQT